jgi:hypothetical protein
MSVSLPDVNLSGVAVGQTGKVSFQNVGPSADPSFTQNPPFVRFYNESGSGLRINFQTSGDTLTLPAGAWRSVPVVPGEAGFQWQVIYNLPNPPVTTLFTDYYYPNENISLGAVLGNSPIGIGGTIPVSNVTLSNEGNPVSTLVIDMGPAGNLNVVQIWNDHFIWSVVQSGVAHQVFKGNTSGNPLQLGQAGDTVEVLGSLTVDQNAVITGTCSSGTLTLTNGGVMSGGDWNLGSHGITASGIIVATTFESNNYHDSAGNDGMVITAGATTRLQSAGQVVVQVPGGTTQLTVNTTDVISQLQFTAPKYLLSGSGSYFGAVGSFSRITSGVFTPGSTSGTITHGLGATPTWVLIQCNASGSTASCSTSAWGATTFAYNVFTASIAYNWVAWRV